ncbi:MAG: hypothetical protein CME30_02155 [Gemmatimonadetes bacterium]|nr:hypothetical protein [Gemmatimonadota bacterium]
MDNFLFNAHSGLRYIILLFGVLTLVYSIYGVIAKRPYDSKIRILAASFVGPIHLQLLLGFALILTGRFQPVLIGHIFMMFLAAAVGQIPVSIMRRRPIEQKSYLPHGIGSLLALIFIVLGIQAIGKSVLG